MKRFISKVQNLSQKAAEIKAAIQQVPPKIAEMREAVATTTGQLQQLKSEIQYSVADLKADQEDHLSEALQEIHHSTELFQQAGFVLDGVDLEISPVQRLLVHLLRVEAVHASVLRSLAQASQHQRTTRAILSSLLQAQQMAETVEVGGLIYNEVIVGIGPIPSVRLCWRAEQVEATPVLQAAPAIPMPPPLAASAPLPQPPTLSPYGTSSFFERPAVKSAVVVQQQVASTSQAASVEERPFIKAEPTAQPAAPVDPLARFKKMPILNR
jgi:hypothetical protein